MRSIALNVTFPPPQLEELREAAAREGIAAGALVRRAVTQELRRLQAQRERQPSRGAQPRQEATA